MPAPRKVTQAQLFKLIHYMEEHKDVGLGSASGSAKGDEKYWLELAAILNSSLGEPKTPSQWRRFWVEKKSQSRRKQAEGKVPLTLYDRRILAIAGNKNQSQQKVRKQYDSSLEQAFISEQATQFEGKTMPSAQKVNLGQLMKLIHYMEEHKDIGLGSSVNSNLKGKEKYWKEIAVILNCMKGKPNTPSQWRRFWVDKKSRTRRKQVEGKVPLTSYERRLLRAAEEPNQSKSRSSGSSSEQSFKTEPSENFVEDMPREEEGTETDFVDSSGSPFLQDYDFSSQDPMQDLNEIQREVEVEVKYRTRQDEEVPTWVQDVEERRLALEERRAIATEKVAVGVASLNTSLENLAMTITQAVANITESVSVLERYFRSRAVQN